MPYLDYMVSKVLAVLFAVLTLPAVLLFWIQQDIMNTENYVEIVAPLASDPDVQSRLAEAVAGEVIDGLDIPALVESADAPLMPLAEPLQSAVERYIGEVAVDVFASAGFHSIWIAANTAGHKALVANLSGDQATVNLGPMVAAVKERLLANGFDLAVRIPEVDREYALVTSPALEQAQRWYTALRTLAWVVPILALAALALALWLSRARFRALFQASLGTVIAMLVLTASTYAGRELVAPTTGAAVYNAFAESLRHDVRWVMAIAAVVALAALFLSRRHTPPLS